MIIRVLFSLLFICLLLNAYGQEFGIVKHLTAETGLPSSKVYAIEQDAAGYIWLATDAGLCKYNGTDVEVFTTENSVLTDNDILSCYKDMSGRIWLFPFNRQLFYIEDGEICKFEMPDYIGEFEAFNVFQTDLNELWIGTGLHGIYRVSADTVIQYQEMDSITGLKFGQLNFTYPSVTTDEFGNTILVVSVGVYKLDADSLVKQITIDYKWHAQDVAHSITKLSNGLVAITTRSNIVLYENGALSTVLFTANGKFTGNIINIGLYEDSRNNYWAATDNGLILIDQDSTDGIDHKVFFEGKSVYRIEEDYEGNFWITTSDEGVYVVSLKAQNTVNYTEYGTSPNKQPLLVNDMVKHPSNVQVIATHAGELLFWYNNQFYQLPLPAERGNEKFSLSYDTYNKGVWVFCKSYTYYVGEPFFKQLVSGAFNANKPIVSTTEKPWYRVFNNGYLLPSNATPIGASIKMLVTDDKGRYFAGSSYAVRMVNSIDSIQLVFLALASRLGKDITVIDHRPTCLAILNDTILLVGGLVSGLQMLINGKPVEHPVNKYLKNKKILDVEVDANNLVWVAEASNGLWVMKADTVVAHFTKASGLLSNEIQELYVDEQNEVWAISKGGVNHIVLNATEKSQAAIHSFSTSNGILSNQINGISRAGNSVFLSSVKGISVITDFLNIPNPVKPKAYVAAVDTGGLRMFEQGVYSTTYPENSFGVRFGGYIYGDKVEPSYKYRLLIGDTSWTYIDYSNVQVANLEPGNTEFEVAVKNAAGLWSNPVAIQLNILPVYWQTYWFKALILFGAIGLSYAGFRFRINRIRESEQRKTAIGKEIAEYKLKAVHAQMNPHFIYNCLNSIQHFVMTNNVDAASLYLMKFAKLMRLVLESSINDEVTLEDEIKAIELYLDLEQLRLDNKFKFTIDVDIVKDPYEILIPSMLIHPYVENAVIHGLSELKADGLLNISFKIEGSTMVCVITDNGPGVNNGKEDKPKRHVSRGMQLINEKIVIVNESKNAAVVVNTIDLKDIGERGTQVTITVPIKMETVYA